MKTPILIFSFFCSSLMLAQNDSLAPLALDYQHPKRWQAGILVTDMISPAISLEYARSLKERHQLGYRMSFKGMNPGSDLIIYNRLHFGHYSEFFHRLYFPLSEGKSLFLRQGLRLGYYDLSYPNSDWRETFDNANRYLEYLTVDQRESIFKGAYAISLGYQQRMDESMYFDFYLGLIYEQILNSSEVRGPELSDGRRSRRPSVFDPPWLREAWWPSFGVILNYGR